MALSAGVAYLDIVPKLNSAALTGIRGKIATLGTAFTNTGRALTKGLTLPIVAFGAFAVKSFMEAESATAQTTSALKSTGGQANVTKGQVLGLATELSHLSGIDDELIQQSENLLLTFVRIRNEVGANNDIFNQAAEAALNLSIRFDKDLRSSTIMVGKALNDPVKGVTALTRMGVQFTDQQKAQIETLIDSNRMLDAQKLILRELETQAGGAAEAYGNTLRGALESVKTEFGNLGETFGKKLKPYIMAIADWLKGLATSFKDLSPDAKRFIVIAAGIAAALGPALMIIGGLAKLLLVVFSPAGLIVVGILAAAAALIWLWNNSEGFRETVSRLWEAVQDAWPKIVEVAKQVAEGVVDAWNSLVDRAKAIWATIGPAVMTVLTYVWDTIKEVAGIIRDTFVDAWNQVAPAVQQLWQAIGPILKVIAIVIGVVILGAIMAIAFAFKWVVKAWSAAVSFLAGILARIVGIAASVASRVRGIWNAVVGFFRRVWATVSRAAGTAWRAISNFAQQAWNKLKGAWSSAVGFFSGVFNRIKSTAINIFNSMVSALKGIWNAFAGAWNGTVGRIGINVQGPGGIALNLSVPDVPYLAAGGIVRQPTLAMIGESGPEAVVPLSRLGGAPTTLTITDWRRGLATLDAELEFLSIARGE